MVSLCVFGCGPVYHLDSAALFDGGIPGERWYFLDDAKDLCRDTNHFAKGLFCGSNNDVGMGDGALLDDACARTVYAVWASEAYFPMIG